MNCILRRCVRRLLGYRLVVGLVNSTMCGLVYMVKNKQRDSASAREGSRNRKRRFATASRTGRGTASRLRADGNGVDHFSAAVLVLHRQRELIRGNHHRPRVGAVADDAARVRAAETYH